MNNQSGKNTNDVLQLRKLLTDYRVAQLMESSLTISNRVDHVRDIMILYNNCCITAMELKHENRQLKTETEKLREQLNIANIAAETVAFNAIAKYKNKRQHRNVLFNNT